MVLTLLRVPKLAMVTISPSTDSQLLGPRPTQLSARVTAELKRWVALGELRAAKELLRRHVVRHGEPKGAWLVALVPPRFQTNTR